MYIRPIVRGLWIAAIAGWCVGAVVACGSSPSSVGVFTNDASTPHEAGTTDAGTLTLDSGNQGCVPKTCARGRLHVRDERRRLRRHARLRHLHGARSTAAAAATASVAAARPWAPTAGHITTCVPFTCATSPNGPVQLRDDGDGCGGTIDCGTCPATQFCGGGGFNQCGGSTGLAPDGGVPCVPATSCPGSQNCGQAADGCGGLILLRHLHEPSVLRRRRRQRVRRQQRPHLRRRRRLHARHLVPRGPELRPGRGRLRGPDRLRQLHEPSVLRRRRPRRLRRQQRPRPRRLGPVHADHLRDTSATPAASRATAAAASSPARSACCPQTCGGGGVPNQCGGNNGVGPDGGALCTPQDLRELPRRHLRTAGRRLRRRHRELRHLHAPLTLAAAAGWPASAATRTCCPTAATPARPRRPARRASPAARPPTAAAA